MRVFLCDDVPEYRALIRAALEDEDCCEVVGEAGDGVSGVDGVAATAPDVVVVDVDMPGGDGLRAIPAMRAAAPGARIVVLSSFDAQTMERRAVAAGADAYLEKRTPISTLAEAVCRG